jgi:hypothetical protein
MFARYDRLPHFETRVFAANTRRASLVVCYPKAANAPVRQFLMVRACAAVNGLPLRPLGRRLSGAIGAQRRQRVDARRAPDERSGLQLSLLTGLVCGNGGLAALLTR